MSTTPLGGTQGLLIGREAMGTWEFVEIFRYLACWQHRYWKIQKNHVDSCSIKGLIRRKLAKCRSSVGKCESNSRRSEKGPSRKRKEYVQKGEPEITGNQRAVETS